MSQYRKKPVVIEAVQWPGTKFESTPPQWFIDAMHITPGQPGMVMRWEDDILIETLEGRMRAQPGDWIIRGVKGEIYPCKPEIFAMTYEVAAPMGQELLPPGLSIAHAELSERLGREAAENLSLRMENRQQADRIHHLERELEQSRAAFIGSENARKDAEKALRLQELVDIGQEIERGPVQSIGDDKEFHRLLLAFDEASRGGAVASIQKAMRALIAYIDGRTARTASAPAEAELVAEAPRSREWQPVTEPGQVRKGDKLRFKIGDKAYNERAKLILHPGTAKEEVIYDKGRNFYFITAMVMSGSSNHKCVEVLAAAPTPTNTGREEANEPR